MNCRLRQLTHKNYVGDMPGARLGLAVISPLAIGAVVGQTNTWEADR
jgi:hypothetical protein